MENWLWCVIGIALVLVGQLFKDLYEKIKNMLKKKTIEQPQIPEFMKQKSVSSLAPFVQRSSNGNQSSIPQQYPIFHRATPKKQDLPQYIGLPKAKIINRISPQRNDIPLNPIVQSPEELVKRKIISLYNLSCRSRGPEECWAKFIGPIEDGKELYNWFGNPNLKQQISKVLKAYRRVRGDGNCYYNSVAFQYFEIILNYYSDKQFQQVIEEMQQMQFLQYYHNFFYIEEALQNQFSRLLAEKLQILRYQPDELYTIMSDPNQEFYALAVIYIRNLANATYRKDSMIQNFDGPDLAEDVLTWECQCDNTELLHKSLALYLNVKINLYFENQGELKQLTYGNNEKYQIHLLYQPGHYEIGIGK